jgi:hypothetical protein
MSASSRSLGTGVSGSRWPLTASSGRWAGVILMLLAHIEALQAELDAASTPVTHHQPGAEHRQGSTPTVAEADPPDGDGYEWDRHLVESPTDDAGTGENTSETGLRGRVRRAARHLRAENRS